MIIEQEKAKRAIILCNAFKDFCVLNSQNTKVLQYANICWLTAFNADTDFCVIEYEETDNAYFDLIVIKIRGENLSACIPVPLLNSIVVAEIFKKDPLRVEKRKHNRHPDENIVWKWEELMSEFVFLNLKDVDIINDGHDLLWTIKSKSKMTEGLINPVTVNIPEEQHVYDARGYFNNGSYSKQDVVEVRYGYYTFWTLKCFRNFFTEVK